MSQKYLDRLQRFNDANCKTISTLQEQVDDSTTARVLIETPMDEAERTEALNSIASSTTSSTVQRIIHGYLYNYSNRRA